MVYYLPVACLPGCLAGAIHILYCEAQSNMSFHEGIHSSSTEQCYLHPSHYVKLSG